MPITEQIAAIERGYPSSALKKLTKVMGLSRSSMIEALDLTPRRVSLREKGRKRFTMAESERIARIVRIRRVLSPVFMSDIAIAEWLEAPDRTLGHKTPLSMLSTDLGAARVENLAKAMIHGVPL